MSILVLRRSNLEFRFGLKFFYQTSTQIVSKQQDDIFFKGKGQYTYSNQVTYFETIILLRSFAIQDSSVTIAHLPHGCTPTNTCPTKNSNSRYLGHVAFKCHANFQINWEPAAHRDQQKNPCLKHEVAPKPRR